VLDFSSPEDLGLACEGSSVVAECVSQVVAARSVFLVGSGTEDVFGMLQKRFKFQVDNERNSREAATLVVASRMSSCGLTASEALEAVRADATWNYEKWLRHVGLARKKTDDAALEVALMHMIWGEAANLRFCPEFLCVVFRDLRRRCDALASGPQSSRRYDEVVAPFLLKVIEPAYVMVAEFAKAPGDHADRVNYCDFNETFHKRDVARGACAELAQGKAYESVLRSLHFEKTFKETRSYLQLVRSEFRVIAGHAVALHALIVAACGEPFAQVSVTLAAALCVRELAELLVLGRPAPALPLGYVCRAARRLFFIGLFPFMLYLLLETRAAFLVVGYVLLGAVAGLELLRFTPFAHPFAMHPILGELSGGEFLTYFRLKDNSSKPLATALWLVAVAVKLYASYRLSVHPLINMTRRLGREPNLFDDDLVFRWHFISWRLGGTDVEAFGFTDARHLTLVVPAWIPHVLFFFLDLEVWYVFLSNLVSAVVGISRGIGSDQGAGRILRAAKHMPAALAVKDCKWDPRARALSFVGMRSELGNTGDCMIYPEEKGDLESEASPVRRQRRSLPGLDAAADESLRRHVWFATTWNVMCETMREQDLVSDKELAAMLYSVKDEGDEPFLLEALVEPPIFEAIETPDVRPESIIKSTEVWRRLSFFVNSLRPLVGRELPAVLATKQASTLVPYYDEPVVYDLSELEKPTSEGVTVLELLKTIYPNEFDNLLERHHGEVPADEIERWAAFRGQTLLRTAHGLSYYDRALRVVAALADGLAQGPELLTRRDASEALKQRGAAYAVLAGLKYTLVLSCQIYGDMKAAPEGSKRAAQAAQIEQIMREFHNVRVAYVDRKTGSDGTSQNYASVLVRWDEATSQVVEVYRVALPGPFLVGEAKPCNQNHAIIFSRGDAVQAIDMNQAGYFEEALKLPFFLNSSFDDALNKSGPRIAGHREHVFTADVSSLASFMSTQESLFVTATQRVLDFPLGVRFHYGHPDFFHRIAAMTCGGVSKASKGINLSEDIFGGFNFVLRGGRATQSDLVQVGKGKDVGFAQISTFQAKIAMGNAEQTLSRDVFRLGCQSDLINHLSTFYSSIGHFVLQVGVVAVVLLSAYCKLFIAVRGIQKAVDDADAERRLGQLVNDAVFASQILGLYVLILAASVVSNAVEIGLGPSLLQFGEKMLLRGGILFYAFQVATKSHYVHSTFVYGKAAYQGTGRGFDIKRADFASTFTRYFYSHFILGCELVVALCVFYAGSNYSNLARYLANEFVAWFFAVALLWTPFLFNPDGFDYIGAVKDLEAWSVWMNTRDPTSSWEAWWKQRESAILQRPLATRFFLVFLPRSRRLLLFWGFAQLAASKSRRALFTFGPSVGIMISLFLAVLLMLTIHVGHADRRKADYQLTFVTAPTVKRATRYLLTTSLAVALVALLVFQVINFNSLVAILFATMTIAFHISDFLLLFANTPCLPRAADLAVVTKIQQAAHYLVGLTVFIPVLLVSFLPWFTELQTRCLWNIDFSTRLDIAKVFARQQQRKAS